MDTLITPVSDSSFEQEVLQANGYVLVDFWAPWCGPCKMLAPTLESVAKTYSSKVKFVKVNVDDCPATSTKYEIRGIPTLLLFKDGTLIFSKTGGGLSASDLSSLLDEHC